MAAPGGLPFWRPRGLVLALPVSQHLLPSLSAQFRLLSWCSAALFVAPCLAVMTCVGLQPSSPCLPSSRTPLRSACPGSWAALAPPLACAQPPQPPQRPRLRPPRPSRSCPAMRLQRPCRAHQSLRLLPPGPAPGLALPCRCRSVFEAQLQHRQGRAWFRRPR